MEEQNSQGITSSRGGRKLIHIGFIYYRRISKNGKDYWKCLRKSDCRPTAITKLTGDALSVLKESEHQHALNQECVKAELVIQRLKRVATGHPELPPAQLFRENFL
ncbi:hypothetical protein ANN_13425 [Periplaneta americana]|uniref:FLYWCH-type domain-containing protein n=1 Tax=Periplaneta americana TaxID=6978 RepID=A0ABQ8TJE4_PERAM|nr:hypothetical protein ANN_13425 [Periplaneta americana]